MARTPDPNSKAAFVRSQPFTASASDVVAAAKAKGIALTIGYVHTARSASKRRSAPRTTAAERSGGGGLGNGIEAEIERIVEANVTAILKQRFAGLFGG